MKVIIKVVNIFVPGVTCTDPGLPINGGRLGTSIKYKDEVTFYCNEGFKLVGSEKLTCMSSGDWFGHIPKCNGLFYHF